MWNLNYHTNEHIYETEIQREQTCDSQGKGGGGEKDLEFGTSIYTLPTEYKIEKQQGPTV